MKQKPKFSWCEETGVAICILADNKDNVFIGTAQCDEEDQDMKSEKTGCQIALWRSEIKYYIHIRDNEIKPALKALKHVYYTINKSKYFNPKSYENKMLWRQIHQKEFDLTVINDLITSRKQDLRQYLANKEAFYNKIRKNRKLEDSVGQE